MTISNGTSRQHKPVVLFRQFMVDMFGDDQSAYKVTAIQELANASGEERLAGLSTQAVGDMLRSWARNKDIFRGWMLEEEQSQSHGHSRFRVVRKAPGAGNGRPSSPKPVAETPVAETPPTRAAAKKEKFSGTIHQQRDNGSMLVINDNGAFVVTPVEW